jgi:hypothetical protein
MHGIPAARTLLIVALTALVSACRHHEVTATTTPTPPVTHTSPSGITIDIDSLNNAQVAPAGTTISVTAKLTDSTKKPLANAAVSWRINLGKGKLADSVTTTNAAGITTVKWTLDTLVGANSMTASISGAEFIVTATGTAGPAAKLVKASPDTQKVVSSATVALVARAVDKYGNPVASVPIAWSATSGALAPATATSGPSGNATVTFTTTAKPSTYTITATAPGLVALTFTVIGL